MLALRQRRLSTLAAAALAAIVLLPLLGHKPLAEWDEAIYAEVSREMLHGSWITPHWNGRVWLEKPPLTLWITALFFKLFGVTEFWARAGSAFSAIAVVAASHAWLLRVRDLLTAWLSSVILLATLGFLHIAHVGETDTLLSLGLLVGLLGLCELTAARAPALRPWLLFFLGFAIAVLSKGPAAICLPLTALVIALIDRWPLRLFNRAFLFGLALFLALVLPWHVAVYSPQFATQYLGFHILTRATQQIEGHHTHWWYYLVVLAVSAPPFCLLFPAAIWRGLGSPGLRPLAVFALLELAFFSAVQTRLPHYIAPLYPVLAILTAVLAADWLRARLTRPRLFWIRTAGFTAAVWALSLLVTHNTLKGLHSASLAGPNLLDNREADALLRESALPDVPGPLLLLRAGPIQSIASVVFYARRPVQQVTLSAPPADAPRDIYTFDPLPLATQLSTGPQWILLDQSLLPQLPAAFTFTPLRTSTHLALGTLRR